ncbi:MAG: tyrosine-type recombinase/integrase [Carboxylicivirga sp.]|nr:tyrosine-type recombinase/integrase [Carboxylicivirga sp.]
MDIQQALNDFLFHCQYEKNLSDKTIKAYTIDLKQFQQFLNNNSFPNQLNEIDKFIIKAYIKSLSLQSPKTAKRKIATVKAMFNFLEFEDILHINPFRKIRIQIKEPIQLPTVMNLKEIALILKTAYQKKKEINNTLSYSYKVVVRDIVVLELLFATGIRVSELCSIKPENINVDSGDLKVLGKGSKERIIQICENSVLSLLRDYKKLFKDAIQGHNYFFINRLNKPLSEQSVRYMIRNYSELAGLTKKVTPHTFRHTFATLLLEQDVDIKYIQQLLGHSSVLTTQIYTHVSKEKQRNILASKHPRRELLAEVESE